MMKAPLCPSSNGLLESVKSLFPEKSQNSPVLVRFKAGGFSENARDLM